MNKDTLLNALALFVLLFLIAFVISSCGPSDYQKHYDGLKAMSNEDIVKQTDFCHSHGELVYTRENSFGEIVKIECYTPQY